MIAIKTQMGRFVKDSLLVDICLCLDCDDPINDEADLSTVGSVASQCPIKAS